jgi:16S rRNA (guanine527-N7)-methyltransferase
VAADVQRPEAAAPGADRHPQHRVRSAAGGVPVVPGVERGRAHRGAHCLSEQQQLIDDAGELGVALSAAQAQRALQLLDELSAWNRSFNLTAITQRDAMIRGHLLDSLSASPELAGQRIADVGTGAGFPGLPLALAAPERAFTLIDSVAKKIRFVSHAVRRLDLGNVTPLQARVETLAPEQPFDTVVARAYAALPQLLASVRGLCGPQTRVLALKGRYPADELAQLPPGWRLQQAREVRIPGLAAERHLLSLVSQGPVPNGPAP